MSEKNPKTFETGTTDDVLHLRALADMVHQSTDMISRHTPSDWCFIYASPAVTPLLGFSVDEIIGMSASELYHPDDVADFEKRASSVKYDRGIYTHNYRFRCKDGHYTWLESTSRSIRDKKTGELLEVLVVSRDISLRKAAEQQAQRHQAEMHHASRLIAMGEMASGLAHELNQPLTAITNYTQGILHRLNAKPTPNLSELREPLERIAKTALRSGDIIHRMRNFARKSDIKHQSLDLQDLIQDVVGFCEPLTRQQTVTLHSQLPKQLPKVYGDLIQVQQILINLTLNAIEASDHMALPESRQVTLKAALQTNSTVIISVQDRGPGLPNDIEQLFKQFYSRKPQGLGMGLSISRSLVEAHGGKLWAKNRDGGGASFHFTLPTSHENKL